MAWYKIYAGLSGAFGGPNYCYTEEFNSREKAEDAAYHAAIEEYQSYEGYHGILNWEECRQDLIDSDMDYDDSSVDERYQEEIESWTDYYVILATGPNDVDEN